MRHIDPDKEARLGHPQGDTRNAVEQLVGVFAAVVVFDHILPDEAVIPECWHHSQLCQGAGGSLNIHGAGKIDIHNDIACISPADPEAAERHALGYGAHGDRPLPHSLQLADAHHLVFREDGILKCLVADADQVMLYAEGCQLLQFLPGIADAGGIVRVGQQNHFGLVGDPFFIFFNADVITILREGGDLYGHTPQQLGVQEIAGVAGVMHHDLISWVDPGHHGEEQTIVGAGVDDDIPAGIQPEAILPLDPVCDQLFQVRAADGHGIVGGEAGFQCLNGCIHDALGNGGVRHKGVCPAHHRHTGSLLAATSPTSAFWAVENRPPSSFAKVLRILDLISDIISS